MRNPELPSFTIDIHRHVSPDQITFTRMQPARSPQWNIYPFGERTGWNYSRFTEIVGLAHADEVERKSLVRRGFKKMRLEDMPMCIQRYIVYAVAPDTWQRKLIERDPSYLDRIVVWMKGDLPTDEAKSTP